MIKGLQGIWEFVKQVAKVQAQYQASARKEISVTGV
jgi:hypothetical protein